MCWLTKNLIAIVLAAGTVAGCGQGSAQPTTNIAALDSADQPLRDDFDRDRSFVRLMFLVDPRCPTCLRGLADMGDDVLARLPKGAHVKVYVVYEPVIGGSEKDIPAAAELLHTTVARHYWNATGDFGRQMSQVLGYWSGSRWIYAWDTWMIYPPDAVWNGAHPPKPIFRMHQLGGLHGKFPFLDSKVFAAKLNAVISAANQKAAAR